MIKIRNKLGQIIKTGRWIKCKTCHKDFYCQKHVLLRTKKRFCSRKCFYKWILKLKKLYWWKTKNKKNIVLKLSKIHKGKHLSLKTEIKKGQHISKSTEIKVKQHLSIATEFKKGHKHPVEIEEKRIKHTIESNKRITKPEIIVKKLIPKTYIHNHRAKILIEFFVPDFVDIKNKRIIELFGDYWHNIPKNKKKDYFRFKVYKRNGYKTLVIWEHELKDLNKTKKKIRRFINDS